MKIFHNKKENPSRTPLILLLAVGAALLIMVATLSACSNSEEEPVSSNSSSATPEETESSDSNNSMDGDEGSSDSSTPTMEENNVSDSEENSESNLLTGLSYCDIASQWQEAYENSFPSDGPTNLEYITAIAEAAPADIAAEWETYRDASVAFSNGESLPAGVDLEALRVQLRSHIEVTCGVVFGTAPTADVEFAGCWARAIWLMGWGVDQDILDNPNQYQETLNTALATQDTTILFPVIEELYGLLGTPPASGTGPGYGSCPPFD
jgi:hypothetical protein